MELELQPLNLPSDNERPFVIAGPCSAETEEQVNLYKYLCNEKAEFVMSKQLLRCGTSIGANIAESEHAQSTADFISKLYISLKEANETKYWITLLAKADYLTDVECESMMKDLRI